MINFMTTRTAPAGKQAPSLSPELTPRPETQPRSEGFREKLESSTQRREPAERTLTKRQEAEPRSNERRESSPSASQAETKPERTRNSPASARPNPNAEDQTTHSSSRKLEGRPSAQNAEHQERLKLETHREGTVSTRASLPGITPIKPNHLLNKALSGIDQPIPMAALEHPLAEQDPLFQTTTDGQSSAGPTLLAALLGTGNDLVNAEQLTPQKLTQVTAEDPGSLFSLKTPGTVLLPQHSEAQAGPHLSSASLNTNENPLALSSDKVGPQNLEMGMERTIPGSQSTEKLGLLPPNSNLEKTGEENRADNSTQPNALPYVLSPALKERLGLVSEKESALLQSQKNTVPSVQQQQSANEIVDRMHDWKTQRSFEALSVGRSPQADFQKMASAFDKVELSFTPGNHTETALANRSTNSTTGLRFGAASGVQLGSPLSAPPALANAPQSLSTTASAQGPQHTMGTGAQAFDKNLAYQPHETRALPQFANPSQNLNTPVALNSAAAAGIGVQQQAAQALARQSAGNTTKLSASSKSSTPSQTNGELPQFNSNRELTGAASSINLSSGSQIESAGAREWRPQNDESQHSLNKETTEGVQQQSSRETNSNGVSTTSLTSSADFNTREISESIRARASEVANKMALQGTGQAKLTIRDSLVGAVDVMVNLSGDKHLSINIATTSPDLKQRLENHVDTIRESLDSQRFQSVDVRVVGDSHSSASSDSQGGQNERRENASFTSQQQDSHRGQQNSERQESGDLAGMNTTLSDTLSSDKQGNKLKSEYPSRTVSGSNSKGNLNIQA